MRRDLSGLGVGFLRLLLGRDDRGSEDLARAQVEVAPISQPEDPAGPGCQLTVSLRYRRSAGRSERYQAVLVVVGPGTKRPP